MRRKYLTCPECQDDEAVRPSHLRLRDLPFLAIGLRSYRCLLCYRRFRGWGRLAEHNADHPPGKKGVPNEHTRRVA